MSPSRRPSAEASEPVPLLKQASRAAFWNAVLLPILALGNLAFSVLILLTALFVDKPLDFNVFPTVLLLATMVRLALNLASTRLILSHGHEGPGAAGRVIEAFGGFDTIDHLI